MRTYVRYAHFMESAHVAVTVPDDPELLDRLTAALSQAPNIRVSRSRTAVVTFECETWEPMLRSRVIQALEIAVGPD